MAYGVVIKNQTASDNIDAYVRNVKSADDVQNGQVLLMGAPTGADQEGEVFAVSKPVTGSLSGVWIAYTPEIISVYTASGKAYRGINPDPRDFINKAGDVFNAFKPQLGDIITITTDGLGGTLGVNTDVVATNNSYSLTWGSAITNGLNLHLLDTTYVSIADGSIGGATGRVTAYRFVVTSL
jgi:hypothetical protein